MQKSKPDPKDDLLFLLQLYAKADDDNLTAEEIKKQKKAQREVERIKNEASEFVRLELDVDLNKFSLSALESSGVDADDEESSEINPDISVEPKFTFADWAKSLSKSPKKNPDPPIPKRILIDLEKLQEAAAAYLDEQDPPKPKRAKPDLEALRNAAEAMIDTPIPNQSQPLKLGPPRKGKEVRFILEIEGLEDQPHTSPAVLNEVSKFLQIITALQHLIDEMEGFEPTPVQFKGLTKNSPLWFSVIIESVKALTDLLFKMDEIGEDSRLPKIKLKKEIRKLDEEIYVLKSERREGMKAKQENEMLKRELNELRSKNAELQKKLNQHEQGNRIKIIEMAIDFNKPYETPKMDERFRIDYLTRTVNELTELATIPIKVTKAEVAQPA